jgi:hypothetical protein
MTTKQAKPTQNQIFSHPIRKMNAEELKKVIGGEFYSDQLFHGKCNGGMDNQGRDFG